MLLILSFKKNVIYSLSENSAGHWLFFVPLIFHCIQDGINDFLKCLFLSEICSEKTSVLVKQPELFQNRSFELMDCSLNFDDLHKHFSSEEIALIPQKCLPQCAGEGNVANVHYPTHK